MKEPLEIVTAIRNYISTQKPLRFPHQELVILDYLNELESALTPIEEEVVVEKVVTPIKPTKKSK